MSKTTDEIEARKGSFGSYRSYRRGIVTLPYLERDLQRDLRELDCFIRSYYAVPNIQSGFVAIGIHAVSTTAEAIDDTLGALNALREYVASGAPMEPAAHERYILKYMRDDRPRQLVLNTLRLHGGLESMLSASHDRLSTKGAAYAASLKLMRKGTVAAWESGYGSLTDHYQGELDTMVGYWKKKLEAAEKIGGAYFDEVQRDLCTRYPDIAKELGVECPEDGMWPIVLIAVACSLLCEGDG